MRILFDARSVRTPSGLYVFQGLAAAWCDNARVSAVFAAIPEGFDSSRVPRGVEPVRHESASWLRHVGTVLPRIADRVQADIIFSPNASPPRDERSVMFFQDLYHFRPRVSKEERRVRAWVGRTTRASWRAVAAPAALLGVAVSTEVLAHVRRRVRVRSVLIPNGVDVHDHRWTGDADEVVVMGGIGSRKDEGVAIRAWARAPAHARDGLRLHVIGVEPATRRDTLAALAASLGVAGSTTVTGLLQRAEFLETVARSRLAISCSRLEAFGLPVAEALALGAPLLCTDIPAHRELMRRAAAGWHFAPHDAIDLSRRIAATLEGSGPPRMAPAPDAWSWRVRADEHLDAYDRARMPN